MKCFFLHAGEKGAERLAERLTFPSGRKLPRGDAWDAVIRYGTLADEPEGPVVIGRLAPILRAGKQETCGELLRQCGLKTGRGLGARHSAKPLRLEESFARDAAVRTHGPNVPSTEAPAAWEYRIPVFQQDALTMYARKSAPPGNGMLVRREEHSYGELPEAERHFRAKRAMRDAVRAVYALGLDYGLVTVVSTADGDTLIERVDPVPDSTREWIDPFAEALNRFVAAEWPKESALMLGADPEFVLMGSDGKVVPASRFMERQGKVGCDAVILSGHRIILPLAELRPDPSPDPLARAAPGPAPAPRPAAALLSRRDPAAPRGGRPPVGGAGAACRLQRAGARALLAEAAALRRAARSRTHRRVRRLPRRLGHRTGGL
nr:hypothetical protein [Gorillibacterium timonense]